MLASPSRTVSSQEGLRSPKRACGGAAESAEEGGIGASMPRDRGVVEENENVQHMHLHLQTKDADRTAHDAHGFAGASPSPARACCLSEAAGNQQEGRSSPSDQLAAKSAGAHIMTLSGHWVLPAFRERIHSRKLPTSLALSGETSSQALVGLLARR